MSNSGVEANLHTFGALIDGCARAGQVAKAFGAYGILRSKVSMPQLWMPSYHVFRFQKIPYFFMATDFFFFNSAYMFISALESQINYYIDDMFDAVEC